MLPVLKSLASGETTSIRDIPGYLAKADDSHHLAQVDATLVHQAVRHMNKAGMIDRMGRGLVRVSDRGRDVLEGNPGRIDFAFLRRFPEYVTYEKRISSRKEAEVHKPEPQTKVKQTKQQFSVLPSVWSPSLNIHPTEEVGEPETPATATIVKSPYTVKPALQPKRKKAAKRGTSQAQIYEGAIKSAIQSINSELELHLMEHIRVLRSDHLMTLVTDLLTALGLGGPNPVVVQGTLAGIGGTVLKDALGVSRVFVMVAEGSQAAIRDLEKFSLGLEFARAKAGVLVSVAGITDIASGFAAGAARRIALLDHEELAYLMVLTGIGVTENTRLETKRVDESFFSSV